MATNFVVDSSAASVSIQNYGGNVRWARVTCTFKYHYLLFRGTLEHLSFSSMGTASEVNNRQRSPDPPNVVKRWDSGFWIPDSLVYDDSATVLCTIRGSLFTADTNAGPAGSYVWMNSITVPIQH